MESSPEAEADKGAVEALGCCLQGLLKDIHDSRAFRRVQSIVDSPRFDVLIGGIICLNLAVVVVETDVNAKDEVLPAWAETAKMITLPMFCIELAVRIGVRPCAYWKCSFNVMDFLIIAMDLLMVSLDSFLGDVSFLRLVRLLRLARVFLVFNLFPELRLLIAGLAGACKSIAWGTLLLSFILIMWSILAVQLIHPLNVQIAESGVYTRMGCERCPHAFESCYQSILTLIQQVVAGDSWGQVSLPIMEAHPASIVFFMGVLLSVGLAVMNLILAVVVNVGITERDKIQADINERNWESGTLHEEQLVEVCKSHCGPLKGDGNGTWEGVVYLDQMITSCKDNKDFSSSLESFGIDTDDLHALVTILDPDNKGQVQWEDFTDGLAKIKQFDQVYMLTRIQRVVSEMRQMLIEKTNVSPTDADQKPHLAEATPRQEGIASQPFGGVLASKVDVEGATRRQEWLRAVSMAEAGNTKGKSHCQDQEASSDPDTSASTWHKRPVPDSDSDSTLDEAYTFSTPRMSNKEQSGQSVWPFTHNPAPGYDCRHDVERLFGEHLTAMQHMHELHVKVIQSVRFATSQHEREPLEEQQAKDGRAKDLLFDPMCGRGNDPDTTPPTHTGSVTEDLRRQRRAPYRLDL